MVGLNFCTKFAIRATKGVLESSDISVKSVSKIVQPILEDLLFVDFESFLKIIKLHIRPLVKFSINSYINFFNS